MGRCMLHEVHGEVWRVAACFGNTNSLLCAGCPAWKAMVRMFELTTNMLASMSSIDRCYCCWFQPSRFFYASSACIYPEHKQLDTKVEGGGLKESDAWPAQPQDSYGLEKLATEELCMHYNRDFGIECRIARFHNIYGPYGTWKGGREKAPAAFCRKVRLGVVVAV